MNLGMYFKKNKIPLGIFILLVLIYALTAKGYLAVPDSEFSLRTSKSIGELRLNQSIDPSWVEIYLGL